MPSPESDEYDPLLDEEFEVPKVEHQPVVIKTHVDARKNSIVEAPPVAPPSSSDGGGDQG